MENRKIIIFYHTQHGNNTKKLVEAIKSKYNSIEIHQTPCEIIDVSSYDFVGFASGVYFWYFGKTIYQQIEKLEGMNGKKCFCLSTSGAGGSFKDCFKNEIEKKGGIFLGGFEVPGHTNYFPLSIFGGLNKGRPNEEDFNNAIKFLEEITSEKSEVK